MLKAYHSVYNTRVRTLSLLLLFFIASVSVAQTRNTVRKPNIIFIMSDDHAYQALSAYGSKLISTPNIDRIAKEGMLMKEAAVTNSVCSPSRAVILTGKYSHMNGMKDNGTYFNGTQQTLPKIFRQHGYRTAIVGKWHLFSTPTGFDHWNILPDQGNYYNPKFIKDGKDTVYHGYVTDVITDMALSWMDKNKDEAPFFLMLHHKAPHRNVMPPLKYLDKFNDRKFPLPANFYDDYAGRAALQIQNITMKDHLDIRYDSKIPCDNCPVNKINDWAPAEYQREIGRLTPTERKVWDAAFAKEYETFKSLKTKDEMIRFQFQRYMEDYLRCVNALDDNIGRVLKYLDDNKMAENTIVVYMSDQGFYLGEHGLYDKRFMYKESFRTPMMIRYPRLFKGGRKTDAYVLNLDIAPTLLDLSGIPVPADMQGKSAKTLLSKGRDDSWRKEIYYHYYEKSFGLTRHYGIRTKRYKLIHFYDPVDSWELYDLEKDPNEMLNIYNDPKHAALITSLKKKLAALQIQYKDDIKVTSQ
jgi:arylsulfatase A-like enzyme